MKKAHFDSAPPGVVDDAKNFKMTQDSPKVREEQPLVPPAPPAKPAASTPAPAQGKKASAAAAVIAVLVWLLFGGQARAQFTTNPPTVVTLPGAQYNTNPPSSTSSGFQSGTYSTPITDTNGTILWPATLRGAFSGDGARLTNGNGQPIKFLDPLELLQPRHVGSSQAQVIRNAPGPMPIFYLSSGSGIVRDVWYVSSDDLTSDQPNACIEVFTDFGGTGFDTNNPNPAFLNASMPLGLLMSGYYETNTTIIRSTRYVDSQQNSASMTPSFLLKLAIPFTNGCMIRCFQPYQPGSAPDFYSSVHYELGSLGYPLSTFRLRAFTNQTVINGTGAGGTTNSVPFLYAPKPGFLVGLFGAFKRDSHNSNSEFEGTWTVACDGISPAWQSAGGEDLFQATYEFANASPTAQWDYGSQKYGPNTAQGNAIDAYRLWGENVISWTNSALGQFSYASAITNFQFYTLALYYGQ